MANKENENAESNDDQEEEKRRHIQERLDDLGVTPGATSATTGEKANFPTKLVFASVLIISASVMAYLIGKNQTTDTPAEQAKQESPYPAMQQRNIAPGPYAVPGRQFPPQSRPYTSAAPDEANTETTRQEQMAQQRMRMQQRRAMNAPYPYWQRPAMNDQSAGQSEQSSKQATEQERMQQQPGYRPYPAWRRPPPYDAQARGETDAQQYPEWRRPPIYQRPPPSWQQAQNQSKQSNGETKNNTDQAIQQRQAMPPSYAAPYAYPPGYHPGYPPGYPWGYYPYPPRY